MAAGAACVCMYVCALACVHFPLSCLQIENPSVAQESPDITVTVFQGLILSATAVSDFDVSQSESDRLREPLKIEQVYFTDSTSLRQDSVR